MSFDAAAFRAQFPIFREKINGKPLHYLDNGATAQTPQAVIDAVSHHESHARANVLRGVHTLAERATEAYEGARGKVAAFLNVVPEEVVFTSGCTAAINLVAYSYGSLLKPGDEIVLSVLEHHSNIVPWQLLAERSGLVLRVLPATEDGRIDVGALSRLTSANTRLIALAHASNVTGAVLDVPSVVGEAAKVGARVLLDGAQRIPQGPLDLQALGVDFYVFSGHKAYAPNGIGVLWARSQILEAMPPFMGGGSMIGRVDFTGTTYAPPPRRFEAGTPPIAQAIGLGAAIDFMAKLDWAGVEAHEMALTQRLMDGLGRIAGARIIGPRGLQGRVPVISFVVDGIHPHDLAQILDQNGVAIRGGHHCAQPLMEHFDLPGTARASIAPYNDESDIDALLEGVAMAKRKLA
jgi:cysteine desulfurase/selenocysteine lyase